MASEVEARRLRYGHPGGLRLAAQKLGGVRVGENGVERSGRRQIR